MNNFSKEITNLASESEILNKEYFDIIKKLKKFNKKNSINMLFIESLQEKYKKDWSKVLRDYSDLLEIDFYDLIYLFNFKWNIIDKIL